MLTVPIALVDKNYVLFSDKAIGKEARLALNS